MMMGIIAIDCGEKRDDRLVGSVNYNHVHMLIDASSQLSVSRAAQLFFGKSVDMKFIQVDRVKKSSLSCYSHNELIW